MPATLLAGLLSIAGSVVARVLIALGMSVVTITGVVVAISSIKSTIYAAATLTPPAMMSLAGLYGVWSGLGMLLGSITFAVTYWSITQSVKVLGAAS